MIFKTFHVGFYTHKSDNIWDYYEIRPGLTIPPENYLKDLVIDIMMHPESKFIMNFYEGTLRPTDHYSHSYLVLKYQETENTYPVIDPQHHPKVKFTQYYKKEMIDDRKDQIEQYLEQNHVSFEYIDDFNMLVAYNYPNMEHNDHTEK